MTEVEIFTDGACRGNPGPGGWAALLVFGSERKEVSGVEAATTNNRMELTAAIGGLGALKRRCAVKLYTDSKYVLQGITEWLPNWKARGWRTAARNRSRIKTCGSCWMPPRRLRIFNGIGSKDIRDMKAMNMLIRLANDAIDRMLAVR